MSAPFRVKHSAYTANQIVGSGNLVIGGELDPDAAAYIQAVETADGQSLEGAVRLAYTEFIVGCKSDGIWNAIKASCIMAGARTLAGALVPLKGAAPTNFNFVSGDYNRKTGLKGNGSTKYLNSNRAGNADPQNNVHLAAFSTATGSTILSHRVADGVGDTTIAMTSAENWPFRLRIAAFNAAAQGTRSAVGATGFVGASRSGSQSIVSRVAGSNETITSTSAAAESHGIGVFARQEASAVSNYSVVRLSFYSIGESLDLALLDARVSALMTALNTAIT
jgi:hypothetical protein